MPLPIKVRYLHIEKTVAALLRRYDVLQGSVPVEKIARGEGNVIKKRPFEQDVSGFLLQKAGQKVIGVNSAQSKVRQRFTIAHELGHSDLHDLTEVHVDHGFRIDYRNAESSEGKNTLEKEANHFAACLLMPRSFLAEDIEDKALDINDETLIPRLAKRYVVSEQAMSYRLINLFG